MVWGLWLHQGRLGTFWASPHSNVHAAHWCVCVCVRWCCPLVCVCATAMLLLPGVRVSQQCCCCPLVCVCHSNVAAAHWCVCATAMLLLPIRVCMPQQCCCCPFVCVCHSSVAAAHWCVCAPQRVRVVPLSHAVSAARRGEGKQLICRCRRRQSPCRHACHGRRGGQKNENGARPKYSRLKSTQRKPIQFTCARRQYCRRHRCCCHHHHHRRRRHRYCLLPVPLRRRPPRPQPKPLPPRSSP